MWTNTATTPSPSRSGSSSGDSGHLSQYDTDGNAHTPISTGLPQHDMDAYPQALQRLRSPFMRTRPPPPRSPGARTPPLSNRQLADGGWPMRLPPFNLVNAPSDPSLGPKCRARVGRPEGLRSPHTSDDDLEPAVSFIKKYRFFFESVCDFSKRVARSYYAGEFCNAAIDSLHVDLSVLSYLQRLLSTCTDDPDTVQGPHGLIQLQLRLVREFSLPEGT
jgi:hypothetical protein